MTELVQINPDHYEDLYRIHLENMPMAKDMENLKVIFQAQMAEADGFAIVNDGNVIGSVMFTNYVPKLDIIIHMVVDRKFKGRWISRSILRKLSEYVYIDLGLPRMSGFAISGKTISSQILLEKTGFKLEGVKRMACLMPDGYHDLYLYGMLRDECRWL